MSLDRLRAIPGFVYFATPYTDYSAGHEAAWCAATQLAEELDAKGLEVFSPVRHFHPISDLLGHQALTHADWMDVCRPFMKRAGALLVGKMPDWNKSKGVSDEIEIFQKARRPIFLLNVHTREISSL